MMHTCPKCHERVEFGADGKPLPHALDNGFGCGGFVSRVLANLAPERTTSPIARCFARGGYAVTDITIPGTPPPVLRWLPPMNEIAEVEADTNVMITFHYTGRVETNESGETYHRYSERGPGEIDDGSEVAASGSVVSSAGERDAAAPEALARTLVEWLFGGRGRNGYVTINSKEDANGECQRDASERGAGDAQDGRGMVASA